MGTVALVTTKGAGRPAPLAAGDPAGRADDEPARVRPLGTQNASVGPDGEAPPGRPR